MGRDDYLLFGDDIGRGREKFKEAGVRRRSGFCTGDWCHNPRGMYRYLDTEFEM